MLKILPKLKNFTTESRTFGRSFHTFRNQCIYHPIATTYSRKCNAKSA